jgi:hypothetical protein
LTPTRGLPQALSHQYKILWTIIFSSADLKVSRASDSNGANCVRPCVCESGVFLKFIFYLDSQQLYKIGEKIQCALLVFILQDFTTN